MRNVYMLTVDITRMSSEQIYAIVAILDVVPRLRTAQKMVFRLDVGTDPDVISEVFLQAPPSAVVLAFRALCTLCDQPIMPLSSECGDYGRGLCVGAAAVMAFL